MNDLIFVHIPRTGGTSICQFFDIENTHDTALEIWSRDRLQWDRSFTFTVVRNPWERAVSYWSRLVSRGIVSCSFCEWVKGGMEPYWLGSAHPMDTLAFVRYGRIQLVDYIGKYEELQDVVERVAKFVGFSSTEKFPHLRQTGHEHYTTYYDPASIEIVAAYGQWEIERFGYAFGK